MNGIKTAYTRRTLASKLYCAQPGMWLSIFLVLFLRSAATSHPLQPYFFPQPTLPGVFGDESDSSLISLRPPEHSEKTPVSPPLLETVLHSITSELGYKIVPTTSTSATSLPTHSVIGTPPSLPASHVSQLISLASTPPYHTITFATTTSNVPINELSSAPKGDGKEWKIVKMLLITIGGVVATILLTTFLKKIWIFLRDTLAGRKRGPGGREEMVPDWQQGSWEVKLTTEGGDRYPTASTMATSHAYAEAIHNEMSGAPSLPPRLALLSPVPNYPSPLCSTRPQDTLTNGWTTSTYDGTSHPSICSTSSDH